MTEQPDFRGPKFYRASDTPESKAEHLAYDEIVAKARASKHLVGELQEETGEFSPVGLLAAVVKDEAGKLHNVLYFSHEDRELKYRDQADFMQGIARAEIGQLQIADVSEEELIQPIMQNKPGMTGFVYLTVIDKDDGSLWRTTVQCYEDRYEVAKWQPFGASKPQSVGDDDFQFTKPERPYIKGEMIQTRRDIASTIIISKDGKILMGRKDPKKQGAFSEYWHIPGGGVDDGESKIEAALRETEQETGIVLAPDQLQKIDRVDTARAERFDKDLEQVVDCEMEFNRYEVRLDQTADEVTLGGDGEFVEMRWFTREELAEVAQMPEGIDFFRSQGYMD